MCYIKRRIENKFIPIYYDGDSQFLVREKPDPLIRETYDDVEEPYFMRTQTGQMRRSTAASKKRNSNYSIRSKMSTLLGKNNSVLNHRLSTGSQGPV